MKNKKIIAATVFLLLLIIAYVLWDNYEGEKDQQRRFLFNKIHKGMDSRQVITILSRPDIVFYSLDSSFEYEYFTKDYDGKLKSGIPTIVFDSLGKVKYASFGD